MLAILLRKTRRVKNEIHNKLLLTILWNIKGMKVLFYVAVVLHGTDGYFVDLWMRNNLHEERWGTFLQETRSSSRNS